ncbi:FCH domain and SH3 domain-containing protein [Strongyloides ratti]|uniref:FCH domain and SH3 domain-containing protein n=1 Tax=Strongyloides ratti TaxID=34506 RepID=A0A090L010_STRRB|nr:FCH domain and SH3 domain-containing protein [Strongyloides ratti]CEF63016.1 FCH domain and SH3 domain-containing protein [Strongyloides ratti]
MGRTLQSTIVPTSNFVSSRSHFSRFNIAALLITNHKIVKRNTLKKSYLKENQKGENTEIGERMSTLSISNPPFTTFYDIGGYKPNIKRIKDGMDQLEEFIKMIKERIELENKYIKMLQIWNSKWTGYVDKDITEGTLKNGFNGILEESKELSKVHYDMKERFGDEIVKTIALFKKENHHSSTFRGIKEIREVEEGFEKAQRNWKKLYEKVESAKKNYHNACKQQKSANQVLQAQQNDTSLSSDYVDKARERLMRCQEDVQKYKGIYEKNLKEISDYRSVYLENMQFVFEKCQGMELKRMKFINEMLSGTQKILVDLVNPRKLVQIHEKLENTFSNNTTDVFNQDLKEWSTKYGPDCIHQWPTYEEYKPELRQISSKRDTQKENAGVILTKKITKDDEVNVRIRDKTNNTVKDNTTIRHSSAELTTSNDYSCSFKSPENNRISEQRNRLCKSEYILNEENKSPKSPRSKISSPKINKQNLNKSPFKDPFPMPTPERTTNIEQKSEITSHTPTNFNDNGSINSLSTQEMHFRYTAKVLYDYTPIEDDEIPLIKGETLEVLSGPDDLGWCYGEKNGSSGLFPHSYVIKFRNTTLESAVK